MNKFEKIYVDGVPTEKYVKIEGNISLLSQEQKEDIILRDIIQCTQNKFDEKEPEKPIAEPKKNSGRASKKGSKRSDKV